MNRLKNTITGILVIALVSSGFPYRVSAAEVIKPGIGIADFPKEYKPKVNLLAAQPSADVFKRPWVAPSANGGYQLQMIGSKFAMVYFPDGSPLAVFDLSLNYLSFGDILMGGLSIGDLSLLKLYRLIVKGKKNAKKAHDIDAEPDDQIVEDDEMEASEDAEENEGMGQVAEAATKEENDRKTNAIVNYLQKEARFTSDWAKKNNVKDTDSAPGVPFQLKTFTLADLQYTGKNPEDAMTSLKILGSVLYPGEQWTEQDLKDFASEFEFQFNEKKQAYKVVWKRSERKKKKGPKLPGLVANFLYPWQNLAYKLNLKNLDGYGEALVKYLGIYGVFLDLILSRITHGLTERLDYHERQFKGILEEAERFKYDTGLNLEYVNALINQLYLSKLTGTNDPNLVNGPEKRKDERADMEVAREKVLKILAKKKNMQYVEIASGKFALAYRTKPGQDDGEFAGVYGLTHKPAFLTNRISLHVNTKTAAFKLAERYFAEVAGFVARTVLPTSFNIGFINIQIPSATFEYWVRKHSIEETQIEGELAGLVDEALAGRYDIPLSPEQLQYTQKHLRNVQLNPYEYDLKQEPEVIKKNLELLKAVLAGESAKETLTNPENLVPIVL